MMVRAHPQVDSGFPDPAHDHVRCVADAITQAEAVCRRQGARLTSLRRRVLELVWQSHRPVGAYDLLDQLAEDGRRPGPPTVYRALEFLAAAGLVHKLHTLNAYVGCAQPAAHHRAHFLICAGCGEAAEIEEGPLDAALDQMADLAGFALHGHVVELTGLCPNCRKESGAT